MISALLSLLPVLASLAAAAPLPDSHLTPTPSDWKPYPAPAPTAAYPDYAWPDHEHKWDAWSPAYKTGCDVSNYHLPAYAYDEYKEDSDAWKTWRDMMPPKDQHLTMTTTARGVVNYICTGGVYVHTGVSADHYDTSCALSYADDYKTYAANLPYYVYDAVPYPWAEDGKNPYRYIWHEYVPYPGEDKHEYKHDYRHEHTDGHEHKGDYAAKWTRGDGYYMYGWAAATYSPSDKHIPWARYEYLPMEKGKEDYLLARTVLRTDTVGGRASPTCDTEGATVSVPYAANYYFYA
ncbi:hypothetical protein CC85DRAFT_183024 [Cutaneotrichosporon oleaginosum]|uniref:Uncharacterized protein n=1 Tax=Cutaneotrichosporon oleaginosum TaxID=879819 RepID=A0A0J1AWI9_9TREE|nr:uncharacterized protein CC85DRAFT_183024 [Cutaneotrichosporon oleaginosum]KLT39659.1 hypothetical protein CC85DRAFT_183024 [Cutaneotrichosporon oleaginosum]TXT07034.1 hypothetical protein COLE_06365 [Cutaneotrichosporon oleaginosum]